MPVNIVLVLPGFSNLTEIERFTGKGGFNGSAFFGDRLEVYDIQHPEETQRAEPGNYIVEVATLSYRVYPDIPLDVG